MRTTRYWRLSCTALAAGTVMCGLSAHGGDAPPSEPAPTGLEWEQEQNLHLNKEAPTASFMSFSDLKSALNVLPENSKWWRSLNGQWKFYWAKDPQSRRRFLQAGLRREGLEGDQGSRLLADPGLRHPHLFQPALSF